MYLELAIQSRKDKDKQMTNFTFSILMVSVIVFVLPVPGGCRGGALYLVKSTETSLPPTPCIRLIL